ncbi:hypothetical protein Tco_1066980 [Tanacetum coccineum]|uniref:Uncharacterized protein n=1 Tax=Tanacetum coccineum TaxID=301880 RepID=A0ABQ5HBJ8_9ASTR
MKLICRWWDLDYQLVESYEEWFAWFKSIRLEAKSKDVIEGTMFLNMDQLEKQLDKEEFQEIGSMAAFKVLETQFQTFIKSRIYLDDEYDASTF